MSYRFASGAETASIVADTGVDESFACSVLMIDDDHLYLDMAASYLRGHGHRVRTASCPLDALEAITAEPPDAVTIDCGLTSLSEFSLLTETGVAFRMSARSSSPTGRASCTSG